MIPLVALPVAPHTMLALLQYMERSNIDLSPAEIADEAVLAWLDARRDEAARAARPVLRGYQWKCLFLPEGTRLRIWCRSEHGHAEVVGDRLMYQGRSVSPNQFVAACSDTVRNAWVEISVLMPGETAWKFASVRRREIQAAARLAQASRNAAAAQPAASLAATPAVPPVVPPAVPPLCAPAVSAPHAAAEPRQEDELAYPLPQEHGDIQRQCPDRRDPGAPLDRREYY